MKQTLCDTKCYRFEFLNACVECVVCQDLSDVAVTEARFAAYVCDSTHKTIIRSNMLYFIAGNVMGFVFNI